MAEPTFDRLRDADVPAACRLSARVGWNQAEADWRRLIVLNPEGTVAARVDGELAATATLATYGRALHWIGMVIVDPGQRGRGLGTAVLDRMIERSLELGAEVLGLDATHLGEPLYRKRGFVPVRPLDRWLGAVRALHEAADGAVPLREEHWPGALRLDRHLTGLDRSALLRAIAAEPGTRAWGVVDRDGVRGYALLRPGREHWHLGPLVAPASDDVGVLLRAAAEALDGGSVLMDAPREAGLSELLERSGMRVQRRLTRMTRDGAGPALMGAGIRLATSLEWG